MILKEHAKRCGCAVALCLLSRVAIAGLYAEVEEYERKMRDTVVGEVTTHDTLHGDRDDLFKLNQIR